ncbi:18962_t:CDS:2, partial [Gigaspora margarita]
ETQSELEKLKQERMQSCTQADKNSKANSSVLDKILDEMGDENHAITWKNINTQLESIFGYWAFADKYSIKLWKEKAEHTF